MSLNKSLRRNFLEAPLYYQSWQARRQAAGASSGTYHVVIPFRTFKVYREHVISLVDCLKTLERPTILHPVKRFKQVGTLQPGDRVLAFAPYRLEPFERVPGVLYAAVNSEHYPDEDGDFEQGLHDRSAGFLAGCHLVFECHEALYEKAKAHGLEPAGVLPFGYAEHWDWNAAPRNPRYDVAFLGRLATDHRRELWEAVRTRFKACPRHEAWGGGRARFLRSARIQLSFSLTEVPQLAGHRFAMALANRCFLLSEPLPPSSPFKAGIHYAEASSANMIDVIDRFLKAQKLRLQIAATGHHFFKTEYRLESYVKRLLPVLDFAMEAVREGRDPRLPDESSLDPVI